MLLNRKWKVHKALVVLWAVGYPILYINGVAYTEGYLHVYNVSGDFFPLDACPRAPGCAGFRWHSRISVTCSGSRVMDMRLSGAQFPDWIRGRPSFE